MYFDGGNPETIGSSADIKMRDIQSVMNLETLDEKYEIYVSLGGEGFYVDAERSETTIPYNTLTDESADEDDSQPTDFTFTIYTKDACGTCTINVQDACTHEQSTIEAEYTQLEFDEDGSASVIADNSYGFMFVNEGILPITINVSGSGFYTDVGRTSTTAIIDSREFMVYTSVACGSCAITVQDDCGEAVTGYCRSVNGVWNKFHDKWGTTGYSGPSGCTSTCYYCNNNEGTCYTTEYRGKYKISKGSKTFTRTAGEDTWLSPCSGSVRAACVVGHAGQCPILAAEEPSCGGISGYCRPDTNDCTNWTITRGTCDYYVWNKTARYEAWEWIC